MNRRLLGTIAKTVISALLIWLLVARIDIGEIKDRIAGILPAGALAALALLLIQSAVATLRWTLIARAIGIGIAFGRAFRIILIGLFFNQTLPSSFGGDAMRVWLLMQEGARLGKAVNAVLSDRVVALVVLIGLMGVSLPSLYARVSDAVITTSMSILVVGGVVGMAVFLLASDRIADLLRRWRFTRPFGELAADFRALFRSLPTATQLCGWSLSIHLLTIATTFVLGRSLGIQVGFVDCLIIVPVVILATTLPLSVAGWGVREGAMVIGFGQVGMASADALAISICLGLAQIVIGLPGGLIWLADRKRVQPPSPS